MRLYLVATVEGMPIMWCLANTTLDERKVMQALLAYGPLGITRLGVMSRDVVPVWLCDGLS